MWQVIVDFGTVHLFGREIALRVYGYGLMLVLGFLLSTWLAQRKARRAGESPEAFSAIAMLALIGGVGGARLAYVIENWESFANAPNKLSAVMNITSGGLIYYGGLGLGTALVLVYVAVKKLPARRYLDMVAVSIMVGLAFGRMGCLLNGCCYGSTCEASWPLAMRFPMYSQPVLKLADPNNPFAEDVSSPSPPYAHHHQLGEAHPDPRLVNAFAARRVSHQGHIDQVHPLLLPEDLHGPLDRPQLTGLADDPEALASAVAEVAGRDGLLNEAEFRAARESGRGPLRGSEAWAEARMFDMDGNGLLGPRELAAYLQARRELLVHRFDADADGQLAGEERARADAYLRADTYALAAATQSLPVRPAQVLGILNALVLAGLLQLMYRYRRWEGQTFALLAILYPITRFCLELVRDDNAHDLARGVLTHNQWTSLILLACGVGLWAMLRRLPPSAGPVLAERMKPVEASGPSSPAARPKPTRRKTHSLRSRSS
jgi:prolipoprotein diacylglyceryltransferase